MPSSIKLVFALIICVIFIPKTSYGYVTPPVWDATKTTFISGKLVYKGFNNRIAPGMKGTCNLSKNLSIDSCRNFRDTILKSPETFKTIYDSGIIENFVEYRLMVSKNWNFAKLASVDFSDAKNAYLTEGNWGIAQTTYYLLKGTSRVVWAVAILNSGEAVYKMGQAGGETVYYLLRYPVGGVLEGVAAPVVLTTGSVWATIAAFSTTGWALPFSTTIDAFIFSGGLIWPKD